MGGQWWDLRWAVCAGLAETRCSAQTTHFDSLMHNLVQLRELVPPSTSVKSPDGGDVKRPKHTVLADTIQLLKLLKDKVGAQGMPTL